MTARRHTLDFSGLLTTRSNPVRTTPGQTDPGETTTHFKPGGYPDDIFMEFKQDERHKYECNICFLVARDPRQCSNSHLFCATCIFTWTLAPSGDNRDKCPVCRAPGRYRPDLKTESRLNRKRVACPEDGCSWQGSLLSFRKHCKNTHSNSNTLSETVLPPIILPSTNQMVAELDRATNPNDFQWRLVRGGSTSRETNTRDFRGERGRRRLERLFEAFGLELEQRRRNIDQHFRTSEAMRQSQLGEVENLGRRLDEVSTDLDRLMNNMHRDSDRYHGYIRTSRNMEESLLSLSQSFPEPVQTRMSRETYSEQLPCLNSYNSSQSIHVPPSDSSPNDIGYSSVSLLTPSSDETNSLTTPRQFHLLSFPRQSTFPGHHQASHRGPPADIGPAINTNLAISRATSRRLPQSPTHSVGPSPRTMYSTRGVQPPLLSNATPAIVSVGPALGHSSSHDVPNHQQRHQRSSKQQRNQGNGRNISPRRK